MCMVHKHPLAAILNIRVNVLIPSLVQGVRHMSPLPKESAVYCDTCGAANRPQARFCIACGQAMPVLSSLSPIAYMGTTPSSPTEPLSTYTLLKGRYRILGPLGRGGMGTVYKAEDTGLGNRLVAVKVMS